MSHETSAELIEISNKEVATRTPAELLETALTSNTAPETMAKLFDLQERWEANQAKKGYNAAIAKARAELGPIFKTNDANGRYKYEDLWDVCSVVDPVFATNGLSYRWRTDSDDPKAIKVTCIVTHRDGYSEETSLSFAPDNSGGKMPIHALGSTVTYLQRYTLKAAAGVAATKDTDGNVPDSIPPSQPTYEMQPPVKQLSKSDARDLYSDLNASLDSCIGVAAVKEWGQDHAQDIQELPTDWQQSLREKYREVLTEENEKEQLAK